MPSSMRRSFSLFSRARSSSRVMAAMTAMRAHPTGRRSPSGVPGPTTVTVTPHSRIRASSCVGLVVRHELVDDGDRTDPYERDPAELRAVRDDHHLRGAVHDRSIGVRLDLVMRGQPCIGGETVRTDEHDIEVKVDHRSIGDRTDELVRLGPRDAAGDEELDVAADRELAGDIERVRHDGEWPVRDCPRDLGRRGAPGEADHGAVVHARAASRPIRRFCSCRRAERYRRGSSYETIWATAPRAYGSAVAALPRARGPGEPSRPTSPGARRGP